MLSAKNIAIFALIALVVVVVYQKSTTLQGWVSKL
jgi:hypothetical protein